MDVFDFAMQMEKDGERYYRELALKPNPKGLANIFNWLADEEVKHYEILKAMKSNLKVSVSHGDYLKDVKNVFQELSQNKSDWPNDIFQVKFYEKALDNEQKSRDLYLKEADETKDLNQKKVFTQIAEEEKKHYQVIENIIELIQRPQRWLEDAEWMHMEEY